MSSISRVFLLIFVSVSYTHLDVYKRQVSKHLTEKYNLDSETLEEQLYDITLMRTAKYLNDDKSDLYKVVAESAAYSILYRCCPGEAQPSPKNLTGLSKYPIEEIGQAVTEISKSIFLEIESIVRNTRHNAIEEIRRNEHNETRENDRRSETRSESQDRGISSGYGNLKGMDVRFGRGEFPVLSDLSEGKMCIRDRLDKYQTLSKGIQGIDCLLYTSRCV